jgi:hypothetical protein
MTKCEECERWEAEEEKRLCPTCIMIKNEAAMNEKQRDNE